MKKINLNKTQKKYIFIFCIIAIIIRYCLIFYNFNYAFKNESKNTTKQVMVIENIEKSEEKICYLVKFKSSYFLLNIYMDKYSKNIGVKDLSIYSNYVYGDILKLNSKIVIPQKLNNPNEFNYKKYLNSNNIVGTQTTYSTSKVGEKYGNPIVTMAYFLKEDISKKIDLKLNSNEAALFKSMMYGDDRTLDNGIKEIFSKNGISHILSVSGSNIANLLVIISIVFNIKNKKLFKIISIFLICIFCIMCSMSLSIIRASIMAVITILFDRENDKISIYKKIATAFLVIMIINPYSIFNVGAILSFIATLGIVMYQNEIYSYFDIKLKNIFNKRHYKKNSLYYILTNIFKILSVTLAAMFFILPLQFYYFNTFEFISLLSNIVIVSIASIESLLGYITIFLIYIPFISDILIYTNYIFLKLIIFLSTIFANLNFFSITIGRPDIFSIILYYFLILVNRYKKYVIVIVSKQKVKIVRRIIFYVTIFSILYIISMYIYSSYIKNYVIYFNVEQGNMAYIRYDRKNIVVDMGSTKSNLASNICTNFMKSKGYNTIDLLLLTHMHDDHINGLDSVLKKIKVKKIAYTIPKVEDTIEYINFLKLIEKYNISTIICEEKDKISFKNLNINILSPPINLSINAKDKVNANSMVLAIKLKKKNLLFMGDATKETEESIVKVCDIKNIHAIQIGHHGSKTSTSELLLQKFNISNAIISSKSEVYGHPNIETLNILKKYKIKTLITQKVGGITIKLN